MINFLFQTTCDNSLEIDKNALIQNSLPFEDERYKRSTLLSKYKASSMVNYAKQWTLERKLLQMDDLLGCHQTKVFTDITLNKEVRWPKTICFKLSDRWTL